MFKLIPMKRLDVECIRKVLHKLEEKKISNLSDLIYQ